MRNDIKKNNGIRSVGGLASIVAALSFAGVTVVTGCGSGGGGGGGGTGGGTTPPARNPPAIYAQSGEQTTRTDYDLASLVTISNPDGGNIIVTLDTDTSHDSSGDGIADNDADLTTTYSGNSGSLVLERIVNPGYRTERVCVSNGLDPESCADIKEKILRIGYGSHVFTDIMHWSDIDLKYQMAFGRDPIQGNDILFFNDVDALLIELDKSASLDILKTDIKSYVSDVGRNNFGVVAVDVGRKKILFEEKSPAYVNEMDAPAETEIINQNYWN